MTIAAIIEELRRLEKEATPAEWSFEPRGVSISDEDDVHTLVGPEKRLGISSHWDGVMSFEDAALIVAMRNALPAILTRLERLEAVAEACRCFVNRDDTAMSTMENALAALGDK